MRYAKSKKDNVTINPFAQDRTSARSSRQGAREQSIQLRRATTRRARPSPDRPDRSGRSEPAPPQEPSNPNITLRPLTTSQSPHLPPRERVSFSPPTPPSSFSYCPSFSSSSSSSSPPSGPGVVPPRPHLGELQPGADGEQEGPAGLRLPQVPDTTSASIIQHLLHHPLHLSADHLDAQVRDARDARPEGLPEGGHPLPQDQGRPQEGCLCLVGEEEEEEGVKEEKEEVEEE